MHIHFPLEYRINLFIHLFIHFFFVNSLFKTIQIYSTKMMHYFVVREIVTFDCVLFVKVPCQKERKKNATI